MQHLLEAESAMRGMALICSLAEMLPACCHSRFICMIPKMRSCLLKVNSFSSRPVQQCQTLKPRSLELRGTEGRRGKRGLGVQTLKPRLLKLYSTEGGRRKRGCGCRDCIAQHAL